jgi:hypothetical protein
VAGVGAELLYSGRVVYSRSGAGVADAPGANAKGEFGELKIEGTAG